MYINSPGGAVVTSGLAIYDTMQFIRPAVSTAVHGAGGLDGFADCSRRRKDMRFSLPNSRIMVHQPSGGFQGQATDIMLHAQEILNLKKRLNENLREAHRPDLQGDRGRLGTRTSSSPPTMQGVRPCRQSDRQASGKTLGREGRLTRTASGVSALSADSAGNFGRPRDAYARA